MTDPIADMLTRIRNASAVKKLEVVIPFSKIKQSIADILVEEGFIEEVKKKEEIFPELILKLKYNNNKSVIRHIQRISKSGRRVYAGKDKLPIVLNNLGIAILSTSKGIMTNRKAKKSGVGGEVICEIY
ncbi:MAG TPA: 30S ribosomal protein S8 [Candidatus Bipolaricaulota bacterium]|nr:30S ribosomal protein S8 [Candidatus Bipolaricaulota bacterium]